MRPKNRIIDCVLRDKARGTIKRHSAKYGYGFSEFCYRYGWDVDHLARKIQQEYQHGCDCPAHEGIKPYTHYGDVTLDIIYPDKEPYYGVNTKWISAECNSGKGNRPPERWARQRIERRQLPLLEYGRRRR